MIRFSIDEIAWAAREAGLAGRQLQTFATALLAVAQNRQHRRGRRAEPDDELLSRMEVAVALQFATPHRASKIVTEGLPAWSRATTQRRIYKKFRKKINQKSD